ncbi:hypothetical protein GJ744_010430 [Endocarpon pusillum]|uniref:Uncharacterized protein n=1 Tax=Endocarpon pusillum TaxID=364733 RepID=A0A8H7AHF8_9EURO|nr:hypothetical protein GJ744_010430 [Endocarpon pusillum]
MATSWQAHPLCPRRPGTGFRTSLKLRARVDKTILQANAQAIEIAPQAQVEAALEAALSSELPEQVKKQGWRSKEHKTTTPRAMTVVEAMERDQ